MTNTNKSMLEMAAIGSSLANDLNDAYDISNEESKVRNGLLGTAILFAEKASKFFEAVATGKRIFIERVCIMHYNEEWSGDEYYPTVCYTCSLCMHSTMDGIPNYCPNCGSRVLSGVKETEEDDE